jgi:hypothetical protein
LPFLQRSTVVPKLDVTSGNFQPIPSSQRWIRRPA